MNERIYSAFHGEFGLYVNDRMSQFEEKENRILFEIRQLAGDKSLDDVDYFMEMDDARLLCFYLERGTVAKKSFERVRGLRGKARSFHLSANKNNPETGVYLKIDHGTGKVDDITGMTTFNKRIKGLAMNLSWDEALSMALAIRERITINQVAWMVCSQVGSGLLSTQGSDEYDEVFTR